MSTFFFFADYCTLNKEVVRAVPSLQTCQITNQNDGKRSDLWSEWFIYRMSLNSQSYIMSCCCSEATFLKYNCKSATGGNITLLL